jgi:hypothetical protein
VDGGSAAPADPPAGPARARRWRWLSSRWLGCGPGMTDPSVAQTRGAARAMILPLALAQFIASYAATNMNVAISAIATDLGTNVAGVQTAITLFTLTMAARKITDPGLTGPRPHFDVTGAVLSAIGLFFVVLGSCSRGPTASASRGRTSPSATRW